MKFSWLLTVRGTGALALAAVIFVVIQEFEVPELRYFCVLLFVLVALSLASLFLLRRSGRVTRVFSPDVSTVGQPTRVQVRLRQGASLPTSGKTWEDELSDGLAGTASGPVPARDSEGDIDLQYSFTPMSRGVRTVGPIRLTATDPFGIARRKPTVGEVATITVAPAIVDFAPLTESAGEAGGNLNSATHQLGQGADNLAPRAYLPGDSMRRIHWRASARRDELMVRQEEQETTPDAIVVLDLGVDRWHATAATRPGVDPAFETAVSACVSAVARLSREGYDVTVLDGEGVALTDRIETGDNVAVEAFAVACATVTARRHGLVNLPKAFAGTHTGPLVLVTGSLSDADAQIIAPIAHRSTYPVLLLVGAPPASLALVTAGGWRVGVARKADELSRAWAQATDRGTAHVTG